MRQLRIGLIGCGQIATRSHIPAMAALSAFARPVVVCDVRGEVAERTAAALGATWTTDYRQIVESPQVDAVVITTPEAVHAEQTVAAARAGKHILCEKPMATTLAGADAMIAAANEAGVKLMIGHSRRFIPRYIRMRELLDAGTIGQPVMVRENQRRARSAPAGAAGGDDFWAPEGHSGRIWRDLARYSLGVVGNNAIHELDLCRWYAGSEAGSVYAEERILRPGREVGDTISVLIAFRNGVLGATDIHSQLPPGYPYFHQMEIVGEEGVLRALDFDSIAVTRFGAGGMRCPTAYETLRSVRGAYVAEHQQFYQAILADEAVPLNPREARAALEMALAATHSAATGQRVELPFAQ